MSDDAKHDWEARFDELMKARLDGVQTDAGHDEFQQLLRSSSEARRRYGELSEVHGMMAIVCDGAAMPQLEPAESAASSHPSQGAKPIVWLAWSGWAVAAALVFLLLVWDRSPETVQAVDGHSVERSVIAEMELPRAFLSRSIAAKWKGGSPEVAVASEIGEEWMDLQAGVLQLDFRSGARAVVQGPARLRVEDESSVKMAHGMLTVLAGEGDKPFTVTTPTATIVDIGTEFGVAARYSGETDVHVFDGIVDVSVADSTAAATRLEAGEAYRAGQGGAGATLPFDAEPFTAIRVHTLSLTQPVRLQFDCGNAELGYRGINSPAHQNGEMHPHENVWNDLIGDRSGQFLAADGSVYPGTLEIDFGVGEHDIDWDAKQRLHANRTRGVFNTPVGRDNIRMSSADGQAGPWLGMRMRGLPAGKYRLFMIARSTNTNPNWGNFLILKQHVVTVAPPGGDAVAHIVAPLEDSNASKWVEGQTHIVSEFIVGGSDEWVTVATMMDRENSPRQPGSSGQILGFQIIQVAD
jgi:ferric-dicitrate binding protein FerR (iron transport regulator)